MLPSAFERMEAATQQLAEANVVPVTMGGDGSESHPQVKIMGAKYQDLAVLHLDSHTDTTPPTKEMPYNAGTQFRRGRRQHSGPAARQLSWHQR